MCIREEEKESREDSNLISTDEGEKKRCWIKKGAFSMLKGEKMINISEMTLLGER